MDPHHERIPTYLAELITALADEGNTEAIKSMVTFWLKATYVR